MGTTDGVYRYNGYSLKKYDYSDGLPNIDVWNLYEDKQGRIWFRAIAQQIGYVKNGRFHKLHKSAENRNLELYPGQIKELDNGEIAFLNSASNLSGEFVFCFSDKGMLQTKVCMPPRNIAQAIMIDKYIVHSMDSFVYLYNLKKELFSSRQPSPYGSPEKILKVNTHFLNEVLKYSLLYNFADKYYCYYYALQPILNILNIKTGIIKKYDVRELTANKKERIIFCYPNGPISVCITEQSVLVIDSNLEVKVFPSSSLPTGNAFSGFNTTYFIEDDTWGIALSSNDNGIYVRYNNSQKLLKAESDLSNYKLVNNKNDTVAYWWNEESHFLATVYKGRIIEKNHFEHLRNLKKIIPYDSAKNIIANEGKTSWLFHDNTYSPITRDVTKILPQDTLSDFNPIERRILDFANDIVVMRNKEIYTASNSIRKIAIDEKAKQINFSIVHPQRYRHIILNNYYNTLICYTYNKISFLNLNNQKITQLQQSDIEALGINTIEKIIPDDNGNIFIKDYNSLKVFNFKTGHFRSLLKSFNLAQAKVEVINNQLYVAGSFGILKANIHSDGNVTIANTFSNTKNIYYKYISDVQFATNYTLLKTDNGSFVYHYHDDSSRQAVDYRVIADYGDTLVSLSYNDTLTIPENLSVINIDIINPTGTGNIRIEYTLNKSPYQFSENQIILPALEPGSYNPAALIASDDSWRSKPLKFTIYVQPKWWQTQMAKRVIVVLSLLAFIGFVYLVIVMTRRIVNNNNERRNQRRELELKSIYSQINPHFIFNSLSTAQYFVKKNQTKEAFEHINQFSDLLRAYIKSSRAKYITIAEEIENLENYLELQLTRFEEKFNYHITVDASVNPHTVKVPSLLLQPLVENALNHGIFHSETKGNLDISFKIDESDRDTLICIVDDDGIGRQKSKELRGKIIRKADSYGTILIKELIDTFNKYEKINIKIEYIDKQLPHTGTTVIIRIKNFTHAQ